jgi:hypothetical protein
VLDLRHIDPQFVRESVSDEPDHSLKVDVQIDDTFAGFTYTSSHLEEKYSKLLPQGRDADA